MSLDHARFALTRASLDACIKCTICETHCPVSAATPLFTGPKWVGPQAERYRHGESVDVSLDYCSSCGTCTLVCPQGVKVAELNSQARAVMKADKMPLRDRLISRTTLMGAVMTPVAPIANAALGVRPLRVVVEKVIGIHRDAPMPTARSQTLQGWLKKRPAPTRRPTRGRVVYFHGCAGGYFDVETSKKAIEVLEYLGYEVLVPKQGCCGLAQQSNGLFDDATKSVLALCDALAGPGEDLRIISSSGSCIGMLKHEAREIMGVTDPRLADVGSRVWDISEFLLELHHAGELPTDFEEINLVLPYHAPCQLKSQGMGLPAMELLGLIPGLTVIESGEACCGIAGTYGLKKEKYDIAQEVGRGLFEFVRDTHQGVVACDTETCRWQIQHSTGVETVHPVWFIHKAYGLS